MTAKLACPVLKPKSQSSTIMTIADDYIHYSNPRALTVREMARLQSFDDSFVFQGKSNKIKQPNWLFESSQTEIFKDAIQHLLARAIAFSILKNIQ